MFCRTWIEPATVCIPGGRASIRAFTPSQLNEYTKLYENQRSRSFTDLYPSHSDSIFSNFFSSIITRPIEAKFHMALPWDGGMKVSSNGFGHMTKMDAMPVWKTSSISSSSEPKGWWPWNLVCSIWSSSTTKFVQMMTLWWPWHILQQGQIWSLLLLYPWENTQTADRLETDEFYEAGNNLGATLIVSLQAQTSPFFQLRERLKCIEHTSIGNFRWNPF